MSKIKALFKNEFQRKKIVFWIFISLVIIFIVIGLTLTIIGNTQYQSFVSEWKNWYLLNDSKAIKPNIDITMFVYGVVSIVMCIIFILASLIYGYSTFSKKAANIN